MYLVCNISPTDLQIEVQYQVARRAISHCILVPAGQGIDFEAYAPRDTLRKDPRLVEFSRRGMIKIVEKE